MNTRVCAVCDKVKKISEFGNGITCPETTCLECKAKANDFAEVQTIMCIKRIIRGET